MSETTAPDPSAAYCIRADSPAGAAAGRTSGSTSQPHLITRIDTVADIGADTGADTDADTDAGGQDWWASARVFAEIGRELAGQSGTSQALRLLTKIALRRLPGAAAASVTVLRRGRFSTVAATDPRAEGADAVQYQLGSGPCVDAILDDAVYRPTDLRQDARWPTFGARVADEYGFLSMLSFRLQVEQVDQVIAGLNIYAEQPDAFDDDAVNTGVLLATHGGIAVSAVAQRDRADNLDRALRTSREIGIAIGILMGRHLVTHEQAFDMLRITSQRLNRKLNELATEVIDTGALPTAPPPRRP